MKFSVTRTFTAPRDKIFAMITDASVLQRCIDVCERIDKTGEDSYNAHLKIRIAGFKRSYIAKVQIRDKKAPESCTLLVESKSGFGFLKAIARLKLNDKDADSELFCDFESQFGGMIAVIVSRLPESVAQKVVDGFFDKFEEQVRIAKA